MKRFFTTAGNPAQKERLWIKELFVHGWLRVEITEKNDNRFYSSVRNIHLNLQGGKVHKINLDFRVQA